MSSTGPQGFWGEEAQLIIAQDYGSFLQGLEGQEICSCEFGKGLVTQELKRMVGAA